MINSSESVRSIFCLRIASRVPARPSKGRHGMKFLYSRASASLAVALCAAGLAHAETLHASYRVSLIGLPIGIAVANSSIVEKSYKVDLNVRLTGLAALVSNLKMALASSGT